jgi:plastocyanin
MNASLRALITSKLGRSLTSVLLGVVILAGAAACSEGGGRISQAPATTVTGVTEVGVYDNYFDAASISVPVGTTVTWTWQGNSPHNVDGDGFESSIQSEGEFQYTFTQPGTYPYECTLHGGMTGEVIVTAAS